VPVELSFTGRKRRVAEIQLLQRPPCFSAIRYSRISRCVRCQLESRFVYAVLLFTTRKLFPPANHGIVEFGDHIERLVTFTQALGASASSYHWTAPPVRCFRQLNIATITRRQIRACGASAAASWQRGCRRKRD